MPFAIILLKMLFSDATIHIIFLLLSSKQGNLDFAILYDNNDILWFTLLKWMRITHRALHHTRRVFTIYNMLRGVLRKKNHDT